MKGPTLYQFVQADPDAHPGKWFAHKSWAIEAAEAEGQPGSSVDEVKIKDVAPTDLYLSVLNYELSHDSLIAQKRTIWKMDGEGMVWQAR